MLEPEDPESVDAVVDALGNARRRYVLYYAREREEVTVDDLSVAVTGWLAARDGDGTAGAWDHERVRAALYHRDLPKLSEAGLVSVAEDGTVSVGESPLNCDLLDALLEHERVPEVAGADEAVYRGV